MINKFNAPAMILLATFSNSSSAVTIDFSCITGNDLTGASCDIAQNQMIVELTDATDTSGNKALFSFSNTGADLESFIADVYFMDGTLLGISSIDNSDDGVQFSEGANPSHLPGYNATASFSADNDPGAKNGVQTGEYLGITFDLLDGVTFADTLTALSTGDLVIGIHAQGLGAGIDDSYSESLTNVSAVPVPAAVWLFGSGLIGLAGIALRKKA